MTSWTTSLKSCRYCVQDRHPFLWYSGVEMLGPDVGFEGPAPVPAGKTVALLFSTLKCSRHFIIVSLPRISTFSRSFRIGPDHHWTGRGITLYRTIRFKERIQCIGPSEFTGPRESVNVI